MTSNDLKSELAQDTACTISAAVVLYIGTIGWCFASTDTAPGPDLVISRGSQASTSAFAKFGNIAKNRGMKSIYLITSQSRPSDVIVERLSFPL